jgi:hypothetical protein
VDEETAFAMMLASRLGPSCLLLALLPACGGQLDAGYDTPHGELPVDERSAMVVINDGARDNWQGEYAALLAASGRIRLVGMVVNASAEYAMLDVNVTGYRQMIAAARESEMRHLPDPTASVAPSLARPASGLAQDTLPNRSEGARLLVQAAKQWGTVAHPLTIATGGALTDVADAWLLDPTLAERAVVVASLGRTEKSGASTGEPNGNRDPWSTFIVMTQLRFVQVNGYYDQLADVPESRVSELPANAFGAWMAQKRTDILALIHACDQVSVLAAALPWFAQDVTRTRLASGTGSSTLVDSDPAGPLWHVAQVDSDRAREELWSLLGDPRTYQ